MAKILLVEDDSNLREIYGARLEAEGYEVVTAGDGEEGLAVAVKERPHLIIADVMMPKISGFDMLDILRTTPETKDVKVIVMTALSQDEDRKRGEELGADKYFVKSQVVLEDLVGTVKELLSDVPGGTPAPASTAAPAAPLADNPISAAPQVNDDLSTQVADFAANDPLMTGTPPNPQASQPDDSASSDSQTPQV
jgi:DNA-binding response OmpR family regulator